MPASHSPGRRLAGALLVPAALLGTAGCQAVGPSSISNGRALYAEVINRTGDEQILTMIVRHRYDETFGLLEVVGVTSQVTVGANTAVNVPVGAQDNYSGNLVPFAAGLSYEESPTISYVPLDGEEFMARLVAPVSISQALTLGRLSRVPGLSYRLMINRINGLSNPGGSARRPDGFRRVGELLRELSALGAGDIVFSGDAHSLSLHDYGDVAASQVRELLDLLRLTAVEADGRDLLIPVREGLGTPPQGDAILVETRSVLDLVRLVGDAIEVPGDDLAAGTVAPAEAEAEAFLRIRSARERPADAVVAVAHGAWWYYIDSRDIDSKRGFVLLKAVISMGLASQTPGSGAPVLTLPVG